MAEREGGEGAGGDIGSSVEKSRKRLGTCSQVPFGYLQNIVYRGSPSSRREASRSLVHRDESRWDTLEWKIPRAFVSNRSGWLVPCRPRIHPGRRVQHLANALSEIPVLPETTLALEARTSQPRNVSRSPRVPHLLNDSGGRRLEGGSHAEGENPRHRITDRTLLSPIMPDAVPCLASPPAPIRPVYHPPFV